MLADGLLDEVRRLRAGRDLASDLPAMRAVGYRQAIEHLNGETSSEEFRARAIAATRQLAKRQITWLRSELDARVFDPDAFALGAQVDLAVADFIGGAN
jgi:tRNA dimethylallyltransferase